MALEISTYIPSIPFDARLITPHGIRRIETNHQIQKYTLRSGEQQFLHPELTARNRFKIMLGAMPEGGFVQYQARHPEVETRRAVEFTQQGFRSERVKMGGFQILLPEETRLHPIVMGREGQTRLYGMVQYIPDEINFDEMNRVQTQELINLVLAH
jgi:hypothetical protein